MPPKEPGKSASGGDRWTEHAREIAPAGGDARALSLTPERRKEIAKKAAEARWGPKKKVAPKNAAAKKAKKRGPTE